MATQCFRYLLWLGCGLLLAMALLAHADSGEAGRVLIAVGEVQAVQTDGSRRDLSRGDPVFEGDTLITGASGRMQVRLTDGSRLALRPGSELRIDEHRYQPAAPPQRQSTSLSLQRGGFRTVTGQVAASNRAGYRVATPFAVIGVRGTEWFAVITDLGQGENLILGVEQGSIFAENDAGSLNLGEDADFNFAVVTSFVTLPEGLQAPPEGTGDLPPLELTPDDAIADEDSEPPEGGPVVVIGGEAEEEGDLVLLLTTDSEDEDAPILQIQQRCL
ncbi:MAG: FecR domain-containing protein [Gammaproteobacteria bacterium]|nr:FecR domain-containing protein [Gammaproteobacteria bacterium]